MRSTFSLTNDISSEKHLIYLIPEECKIAKPATLSQEQIDYVTLQLEEKKDVIRINHLGKQTIVVRLNTGSSSANRESCRTIGARVNKILVTKKIEHVQIDGDPNLEEQTTLDFVEGLGLASYSFDAYKSEPTPTYHLDINTHLINEDNLNEVIKTNQAVCWARDLVNEPYSTLDTEEFVNRLSQLESNTVTVEVLGMSQLESLKMNGLLAVNQGSTDDAAMVVMSYAGASPDLGDPIVLVGKGVVYDTGGLSLKPTPKSMDFMKCDMGGAATAASAFRAAVDNKLEINLVCIVPITDNWPGPDAFAPGDVVDMANGLSVEILNTDAEGRMILADALLHAKKFAPKVVMDFATLTGSAARTFGSHATPFFSTEDDAAEQIIEAGDSTYERVVRLPLWDEYAESLKSDIADCNHLGAGEAGTISAAKFLQKFIDYPWMHFDIAGTAWYNAPSTYRPKNGTGIGVRLVYQFLKSQI